MINYINVPEGLYNLLSDDLQYNLKLVSNYFNIDSNQIMYDIDEILTEYNIIRQTNCLFSKEPYTVFCILKDNQQFLVIPPVKFLVR